ncbi:MAG: hypothetical protein R3F53_28550 [Gammaproteobacteria bacterium]
MADPVSIEAAQRASTVAVSLNLISKSFGATLALDNVSRYQAGSVHALLGENGAGKSAGQTAVGLIEPDQGISSCSASRYVCRNRAGPIVTVFRPRFRK